MNAACPRIVIGGTGSGVGKTSLTLGLTRWLTRQGWRVQTFKVGMISSMSKRVMAIPVNPLTRRLKRAATPSNQPQRRGLPVVVPNSCALSLIWLPISSFNSVGKGPPPTRVQ